MQFKDLKEIQEFLVWAKQNQIARVKVNGLEAEFSNIGLAEAAGLVEAAKPDVSLDGISSTKQNSEVEENDELLFWSSQGG